MEKGQFFSYSWHIDENERDITVIRVYGLNERNENVCVTINNFTPYVYLELPDTIDWDNSKAQLVANKIDFEMRENKPLTKQLMFKKRLYYARLDKNGKRKLFPYLCCSFSHVDDIRKLSYKIRRPLRIPGIGVIIVKIHEHNASPVLQLTSLRKLPTAGWIEFVGKKVAKEEQNTRCEHEYVVKWKNLIPKESDEVAHPLLMGYDIEAYSTVSSAMPNADRPGDKVFQISCVFSRQGAKEETYQNYLLTLGVPDFDFLENIEVLMFDTESELLVGFTELIQEKQPNVIIGYNIFTFDIPYMIDRAKLTMCIQDFDRQGMDKYGHARERVIKWSSSAYSNQAFQFLDAEGRLFIDLLPLIKRDYKLSNYKLKTISAHFLKGQTKDPLDAKGIFKCYRLGMKGGKKGERALGIVGKYCVKDSVLVVKLFEVLTTWVALCEMSKVTNVPIFALYTQGQQLKVFSQVYKKCAYENTVVEKDAYIPKDNDHYVGATVFPPVPGVYDKVLPFDFSSLYPTTIIAYNISWDTLVPDDSNIPDEKCNVMIWEDHIGCCHDQKEIRKAELNKIIKQKDTEVNELRKQRDLKCNKNRKDEFKKKIDDIIEETKPYRKERSDLQKSKPKYKMCCQRKFRWLKEPMGVLPEILTHLLDTRKMTKKIMKKVNNELKTIDMNTEKYDLMKTYSEVLDKRQLALKVSANSAYGAMGVQKGYLPLMPGAMSTTYKGREAVQLAANEIQKKHGGKLIYGDTDSNYITFPHLQTAQECWDYSEKVAAEVTKLYPSPMNLAFEEKIYWRFFIITKKRYMSLGCERDGIIETNKDGTPKINKKGVLLQRRDNCNFIRKVYSNVIMMIFNKVDREEILYKVIQDINNLCSHYYSTEDFIITKSIRDVGELSEKPIESIDDKGKQCWKMGDYKVSLLSSDKTKRDQQFKLKGCNTSEDFYLHCLPAQAQLAERMRRRGQLVAAGSRIEYVITTEGGHNAKQYVKVEDADYFSKHSDILKLDYMYYLKQLANPLDQVLDIMYDKDDGSKYKYKRNFVLEQYKYRLNIRNKLITEIQNLFKPRIKIEK